MKYMFLFFYLLMLLSAFMFMTLSTCQFIVFHCTSL